MGELGKLETSEGIERELQDEIAILNESLNRAEAYIQALENAGVDNWEGFDFAMEELERIYPGFWGED